MAQMFYSGGELIRINPGNRNKIEYSKNSGVSWKNRYLSSSCGNFYELIDNGKEILGMTSQGLYYSTNGGGSWIKRS